MDKKNWENQYINKVDDKKTNKFKIIILFIIIILGSIILIVSILLIIGKIVFLGLIINSGFEFLNIIS